MLGRRRSGRGGQQQRSQVLQGHYGFTRGVPQQQRSARGALQGGQHEDYDDFGDTFTGRFANKVAASGKKDEKPTVTCNNLQFEVCEKAGAYYNLRTGELLNVE